MIAFSWKPFSKQLINDALHQVLARLEYLRRELLQVDTLQAELMPVVMLERPITRSLVNSFDKSGLHTIAAQDFCTNSSGSDRR